MVSVVALHAGLAAAWTATQGDERICIAVLDGPVDRSHVVFKGARLSELEGTLSAPYARTGAATAHGTHVASIIFGRHESPIKGIAPRCRGLLIPIFGNAPDGGILKCTQIELADAIRSAVEHGAHIINISGGEFTPSGIAHPVLAAVLNQCDRDGVLIVAAAGNDGCNCLHIPAAHPSILAVGGATAAREPHRWSNWGSGYQGHGLLALGENVLGAAPGGKMSQRSGTSSAAAIVSGVAALLMSLDIQRGIRPNGPRIRDVLLQSSDPCPNRRAFSCRRYLSGVLNINRAFSLHSKKESLMNLNESNREMQSYVEESYSRSPSDGTVSSTDAPPPIHGSSLESTRGPAVAGLQTADVDPAACACGGSSGRGARFVFALGQIDYSFGSLACIDSIQQHMRAEHKEAQTNPKEKRHPVAKKDVDELDPTLADDLLWHLDDNRAPWDATSVIWTLIIEDRPVYAISVKGPNSTYIVKELKRIIGGQAKYESVKPKTPKEEMNAVHLDETHIERVSVAGVLGGTVRLVTGEVLPVIHPELRGMIYWNNTDLARKVANVAKTSQGVGKFLERICFDFRNLGLESADRAINFVATNPHDFIPAFEDAANRDLTLLGVGVERSLVCRPGSECWDVRLEYFDTKATTNTFRRVYRIAVDVSDVVPVVVGDLRYWSIAEPPKPTRKKPAGAPR